ncbi:hypothetical protein BOO71_0009178 [Deinococcus marmoris]|uniref:Uncharacterized protein n=1 Tax=Deinococcus marmoris TaxID=249408 RepID=A0A1U7NWR5_9DEIO|nr:hypothetical protein BOO71_0009178 [Deinococcus marmoris]
MPERPHQFGLPGAVQGPGAAQLLQGVAQSGVGTEGQVIVLRRFFPGGVHEGVTGPRIAEGDARQFARAPRLGRHLHVLPAARRDAQVQCALARGAQRPRQPGDGGRGVCRDGPVFRFQVHAAGGRERPVPALPTQLQIDVVAALGDGAADACHSHELRLRHAHGGFADPEIAAYRTVVQDILASDAPRRHPRPVKVEDPRVRIQIGGDHVVLAQCHLGAQFALWSAARDTQPSILARLDLDLRVGNLALLAVHVQAGVLHAQLSQRDVPAVAVRLIALARFFQTLDQLGGVQVHGGVPHTRAQPQRFAEGVEGLHRDARLPHLRVHAGLSHAHALQPGGPDRSADPLCADAQVRAVARQQPAAEQGGGEDDYQRQHGHHAQQCPRPAPPPGRGAGRFFQF